MCVYSIKDLERLSGIKAHTLRIWEQRYQFITPQRTGTNIRYYTDQDLRLALNVSLLKDNGYKISQILRMGEKQLSEEALTLTEKKMSFPEQIQALTLFMVGLDEARFEKALSTNILRLGFERTMTDIIFPFFERIGFLWQSGSINPAHEHFISHLVRQKLMVAIDGQNSDTNSHTKKFLLFLPEGEMHELTLLFSCFLIKARKQRALYLGQNVPLADLIEAAKSYVPDYLLTVITLSPPKGQVRELIADLSNRFSKSTLLVAGRQVSGDVLHHESNVVFLQKFSDLTGMIDKRALKTLSSIP